MKSNLDMEKAKRNIEVIREKMHSNADIFLLKEYHKLYRKEISLFERSWAAAWLFMYYDQKENPPLRNIKTRDVEKKSRINEKKKAVKSEKPVATAEAVLSDEESKRLFISIGKNRRLFPKEVISLILSKTTAQRGDIGAIRILDNFSFVQVRDSKADEIIKALGGVSFRGRNLTVDYAKPKNDAPDETPG